MRNRVVAISLLCGMAACSTDKDPFSDEEEDWSPLLDDADGDGFGSEDDCNDSESVIFPGAEELCDGIDNDCDGEIDENVTTTYFADIDGDGFGDASVTTEACQITDGWVLTGNDCDDSDPNTYPGAAERCDDIDNDCDTIIDEDVSSDWYADTDEDGFGDPDNHIEECDPPSGYVADDDDCDDSTPSVFPGASEICDEMDNDCDGVVDEGVTNTYYEDVDGDAWGNPDITMEACDLPGGYSASVGDCDDTNENIHPEASEICNGIDDDCDDNIDDDDADISDASTWYIDYDADGFGTSTLTLEACNQPVGYVSDTTDCDDTDADINPDAEEVCNGIDDNCDGATDDGSAAPIIWYEDADEDGYGNPDGATSEACDQPSGYSDNTDDCDDSDYDINPAAAEECNGYDDDCDGTSDNASVCPCDVEYYDGDTTLPYMFCTDAQSWSDAQTTCDTYGYHLLTIDDDTENGWADDTADTYSTSKWWIGLNDRTTEGTFEWEDGSTVSYTNWQSGEPNNGSGGSGNEDCVQLNRYHPLQTWNDEPCSDTFYFVCEAW